MTRTTSTTRRRDHLFRDRREAGRILGELLTSYRDTPKVVVLGLARGGVPVAFEVAKALQAPLDAFIVRKLGIPDRPEFAMGAIAAGGRIVLNDDVVRGLRLTPEQIRAVVESETEELYRREAAYRGSRPPADVTGKTVILVDDGLATGASMQAAVIALRESEPAEIVVAVPAAPESTCRELAALADDVICASMPTPFFAVGESYWDFTQTGDDEVRTLLATPTTEGPDSVPETDAEMIARVAVDCVDGVPPDDVLDAIVGDARIVLIGESSHGTHEFYAARAHMTRWLIENKGFTAVAAEADWPDAYRVNRWVRGFGTDGSADEALSGFERFPAWMWRNVVVRDFVQWLHGHNAGRPDAAQVGFYGLDLYSLHRSMHEVIEYLTTVDPVAAQRARERYACFDHTTPEDGQAYGYAAAFGAGPTCEREAVDQLVDLNDSALQYLSRDGLVAADELFSAQQNAQAVRNSEVYYRTMFRGRVSSWNVRDEHMAQTLDALLAHLDTATGQPGKVVVWAHNSHVGDARATEVGTEGQLTLGQLVRQRHPDTCRLIGFSTYRGTVTAADDWGESAKHKTVRQGLPGSIEEVYHEVAKPSFLVRMDEEDAADALEAVRLARAIGVIYRPDTERQSHYYHVRPADQYDAMIHIDRTHALAPLEPGSVWLADRHPETYPSGL
ncbi:erythromycin esterase family protein [Gordonia sp. NPDC003424]